jgi:hypothetical protein
MKGTIRRGWPVPPPKVPTKTASQLAVERQLKVTALEAQGLLKSERIGAALLKVPREDFVPPEYRDFAYEEVPLPLPGTAASISCPHSYPLFYEPLGLGLGHRFLEIGTGSGYGAAVAREVVGDSGQVTSIEIDPLTYAFARQNLERVGYADIVLVLGDGGPRLRRTRAIRPDCRDGSLRRDPTPARGAAHAWRPNHRAPGRRRPAEAHRHHEAHQLDHLRGPLRCALCLPSGTLWEFCSPAVIGCARLAEDRGGRRVGDIAHRTFETLDASKPLRVAVKVAVVVPRARATKALYVR